MLITTKNHENGFSSIYSKQFLVFFLTSCNLIFDRLFNVFEMLLTVKIYRNSEMSNSFNDDYFIHGGPWYLKRF